MSKLLAHREAPIPSLCSHNAEIPASVDAVFRRMVAKRATDRQQSMTEVIHDLENCLDPDTDLQSFLSRQGVPSGSSPSASKVNTPVAEHPMNLISEATLLIGNVDVNTDPKTMSPTRVMERQGKNGRRPASLVIIPAWRRSRLMLMLGGSAVLIAILIASTNLIRPPRGTQSPESLDPQLKISGRNVRNVEDISTASRHCPFDAATAKKHQQLWAKHLGVPVDYTNSVGMRFTLIPPGEFTMGSTPAESRRRCVMCLVMLTENGHAGSSRQSRLDIRSFCHNRFMWGCTKSRSPSTKSHGN